MEVTDRKLEANRANGKLGGVKTVEGRAISCMNAIKHGILANGITKYDSVNLNDVMLELTEEYRPLTPSKRMVIEVLALTYIQIGRSIRLETELINESLNPPEYSDLFDMDDTNILISRNDMAVLNSSHFERLDIVYNRYGPKLIKRLLTLIEKLNEM